MHPDELANWQKIKDYLEEHDKTDSFFYKRAVAITAGSKDPMPTEPSEKTT